MTQLPPTTNLEQLKREAKTLLKRVRGNDPAALARFLPYFKISSESPPKLYQAQLVIARELGFASWPKLKVAVEHLGESADADVVTGPNEDSEHLAVPVERNGLGKILQKLIGIKATVIATAKNEKKAWGGSMRCSFCGKSPHEIKKLIAGPGIYICNECVGLCNNILNNETLK